MIIGIEISLGKGKDNKPALNGKFFFEKLWDHFLCQIGGRHDMSWELGLENILRDLEAEII